MKKIKFLTLALVLVLALTACGGSAKSEAYDYAAQEAPAMGAPMEEVAEGSALNSSASADGSTALPENRKWIITVDISAETEDLDTLTDALDEKITEMQGYVEDQSIYNGSNYSSRRYRSAHMTIRIPAEDVDRFTDAIGGIANVVRKEKSLEDVTLSYTSTETRLQALKTEEARLLEFMEQAETMADLLEIEARLTDVRYELENAASRLRLYDNQIDYATIYLSIEEVQEYTPVEEPTFLERITTGFTRNLEGLWEGVIDLTVWIITSSPYLVVYGALAFLAIRLFKFRPKFKFRRKAKKNDTNPEQK